MHFFIKFYLCRIVFMLVLLVGAVTHAQLRNARVMSHFRVDAILIDDKRWRHFGRDSKVEISVEIYIVSRIISFFFFDGISTGIERHNPQSGRLSCCTEISA